MVAQVIVLLVAKKLVEIEDGGYHGYQGGVRVCNGSFQKSCQGDEKVQKREDVKIKFKYQITEHIKYYLLQHKQHINTGYEASNTIST